jgi:solute carrier family 8 (sodium/calcium exchanger)
MFSCSDVFKACDTNPSNVIQPQRVPQQGLQYQQPPLRQDAPPAFSSQVPNRAVQSAYAEEKAISAGLQNIEPVLELQPEIAPPPPIEPVLMNNDPYGMEDAKPPPEPLELGPAPNPPSYQDPNAIVAAPVAPLVAVAPQGPDLKEPEPEEAIEYNAAAEFKKASIATGAVVATCIVALGLLFVKRGSNDDPVCPDADWYKLNDVDGPGSCEPCGEGTIVLPLGGEWEKSWSKPLRALLYFLGLGWCFLGIAIVCDQFMAAIEEVTSKEKVVWVKVSEGTKHKFHKKVWNDTVANLTLMALGSSAPEILLSVIELISNQFFAGELGPSTIVGSAAFNLLVITAVCVAAIPAPDIRKIDGLSVFAVTASLSVFAYVWLIIILQMMTPDVVTKNEALMTFGFFPMLVIIAFCADKGYLGGCPGQKKAAIDSHITDEQQRLEKLYSKKISFETVKMMVEETGIQKVPQMTKAQYRRQVMKGLVGGAKDQGIAETTAGFAQPKYITLECAGTLDVPVKLSSRVDGRVEVRYFTQDGLALAGKRYHQTEGTFVFQPGELEKMISVPIIDNEVWEEQEDFTIFLENLNKDGEPPNEKLGYGVRSTKVVILNDDEPGTLCFFVDEVKASRDAETIQVGISRVNGSTGRITCRYHTQDDTAVSGSNYTAVEGELAFEDGACKNSIEIGISPMGNTRKSPVDRSFRVVLTNPSEGVKFDVERDGGQDRAICEVILPGASKRGALRSALAVFMCDMKFSHSIPEWKDQFVSAFYCNGNPADQSTSTKQDWIFHLISQPFKFVFAFVPPAAIAGGWACFLSALAMIGGVTMIVGDMAALMGCCLGIPDDITAITIVALGTSLPDTFASKSAAMHDPNADNSIGNVTGSNCVNVFLGLGLPWSIAAMYWDNAGKTPEWIKKDFKGLNYETEWGDKCPDGCFLVPAGNLSFSVTVFTMTALSCIALLCVRRVLYGGELGGPAFAAKRDAVILVSLWFLYIVMSIMKSMEMI